MEKIDEKRGLLTWAINKEGAQKAMKLIPHFPQKQFTGIALAPLSEVDFDPGIIILETVSEHLMWLSLAAIYQKSSRFVFTTSVSNGGCVDITVVPYTTQKLNISLGYYGCRNATSILPENLLAGFPDSQLPNRLAALQKVGEKITSRTREKKAYARLK